MNTKTPMFLMMLTLVVVLAYLMWARCPGESPVEPPTAEPQPAEPAEPSAAPAEEQRGEPVATIPPEEVMEQPTEPPPAPPSEIPEVVLDPSAAIVQVVYQQRGNEPMVFARIDTDFSTAGNWMMLQPVHCRAKDWLVNDIILAVKGLDLQSAMGLEETDTPTLEEAGLRPLPVARFGVTTTAGRTVEVEVGNALLGQHGTYIYLPDQPDTLYAAAGDFDGIIQREPVEFRERQMFEFLPSTAVQLTVRHRVDEQITTYVLARRDGQWHFESPFQADADSDRIDDVVGVISRLRSTGWMEQVPEDLGPLGLDPPYLHITVTTQIPSETPGEPQRRQYVLMVADRGPMDSQERIYAKRGDDDQVGTIAAEAVNAVVPLMSEWRDAAVLDVDPQEAFALSIRRGDDIIRLQRGAEGWTVVGPNQPADPDEIAAVLTDLARLEAVAFVEGGLPEELGLEPPVAEVTLELPQGTTILDIGDFTETVERRLRYARRPGDDTVLKVRSDDLQRLFQSASAFRNREILRVDPGRLIRIDIDRQLPQALHRQRFTLERDQFKVWHMTAPTTAEVDLRAVNELVDALAAWRGQSVLDETDPDKLGLLTPDINLTLTLEGLSTIRVNEEGQAGTPTPAKPVIRQVALSRVDGHVYAHRLDVAAFVEVDEATYELLLAEVLPGRVWNLDPFAIVSFGATGDKQEAVFNKARGRWQYEREPDLPLASEKIEAYLQRLPDVRTRRFVEYSASNLQEYGFDLPARRLFFVTADGSRVELLISGMPCLGATPGAYAMVEETPRVFILGVGTLDALAVNVADFEPES